MTLKTRNIGYILTLTFDLENLSKMQSQSIGLVWNGNIPPKPVRAYRFESFALIKHTAKNVLPVSNTNCYLISSSKF